MLNVEMNSQYWDGDYDWSGAGEEWSAMWGGSRAQWLGSLYPRIAAFLPVRSVLEIAPGFGRWTRFLLAACDSYQGVDLSQECIDACKSRFARVEKATFFKNDGKSLNCSEDGSIDFLFSFDSLVHASIDVLECYIPEILLKLSRTGVAFIHHSNWLEVGGVLPNDHGRAIDVSAQAVRELIVSSGGKILIQEKINWGFGECTDCLTLFCSRDACAGFTSVAIENHDFMNEGNNIRKFQSPYSDLASFSRASMEGSRN